MAAEVASPGGADFFFKGESGRNTRGLLRLIILCTIAAAAVASRLFSVIRFESIIHECTSINCWHTIVANACNARETNTC
jgi:dolichyl-diphosphooligosaccharide--protein glycosyltransferase